MDIAVGLKQGTVLNNRYRIESVIGMGGFGITYRALDETLQDTVAIKEYFPSGIVTRTEKKTVSIISRDHSKSFEHGVERFLREARDVVKFKNNPNIVSVTDFFKENGTAYMVMEYLEGVTLNDYMKARDWTINEEMTIQILFSLMNTLEDVHNRGMVHRDISPDNVFVCKDNSIKLIDFGAAKQDSGLNPGTASIVLKQGYAPVEQYSGKGNIGPWTDVYAFGSMMYYLMTGTKPKPSIDRVMNDELVSPRKLNPNISEVMDRAIMKALALKAEDRFQNMGEMRNALLEENESPFVICQANANVNKESSKIKPENDDERTVAFVSGKTVEVDSDFVPDKHPEINQQSYFKEHLVLFFSVAILLVIILAALLKPWKKKDAQSAGSIDVDANKGALYVENGVFIMDPELFDKSYAEMKKIYPDLPEAVKWTHGKGGYDITYLDYYHSDNNKYVLYFNSDKLFSVIYEKEGDLLSEKTNENLQRKYGNKGMTQYTYYDGTPYWYDWKLDNNILLSCYRNRYDGTYYICQEYSKIPYGSRNFEPQNTNPVVTSYAVHTQEVSGSNMDQGSTLNIAISDQHFWYLKMGGIGYLDSVQFTYKSILSGEGFSVETEGDISGNVKDKGTIEIIVDVKSAIEKAGGRIGETTGQYQETVEIYAKNASGNGVLVDRKTVTVQ